jgi:hypothetical protein
MSFWSKLIDKNDTTVHTPYVLLMAIGIIIMFLSVALIIYHCFIHKKGIDGETVKLILGLLGGGVLNAGASYFQKTTFSSVSGMIAGPQPGGGPAPTSAKAPPIGDAL